MAKNLNAGYVVNKHFLEKSYGLIIAFIGLSPNIGLG
jgi:hypothetical protein